MRFREWALEENKKYMSLMGFGKHRDDEIQQALATGNVQSVPTGYLRWVYDNATSGPAMAKRAEIEAELARRAGGQPQQPIQQPQQPQQPQQSRPTQQNTWFLAHAIKIPNVEQGNVIVVAKSGQGWEYMDRQGVTGILSGDNIGDVIRSIKSDVTDKAIRGPDPKALFAMREAEPEEIDDYDMEDFGDGEDSKGGKYKPPSGAGGRPSPESVRLPPEHMTEFNQAIEDRFTGSPDNIMIDALAGTGKTTMLKHLSSFIKPGEKWLYLVFNKKNQVESQTEFPAGIDVLTTHAFLGRLLKKNGKDIGGDMELPPRGQKWKKIQKIADELIPPDWPESAHSYRNRRTGDMTSPFNWKGKNLTTKISEMAKAYALNPADPQFSQQLMQLIDKCSFDMDLSTERREQDRDYTPDIIEMATELLKLTLPGGLPKHMAQEFSMYRDQDDTLWFTALNADNMRWDLGYDVVLMDEVQDFNQCQLVMANKLKEAGARVIGVGDPNQGMYLFRGADSGAFDKLKEIVGGGQSDSLPINFRSGGNIIDWVKNNTHVSDLQAAPHLEGQGEVYAEGGTHPPLSYEEFMAQSMSEYQQAGKFDQSTAMICRTNAPLAHAALSFLKNNIEFQIIGKDLSKDLLDLIKKVTWHKPERHGIEEFGSEVVEYVEDLADKWGSKISKKDELKDLKDYADVLVSVIQHLADNDFRENERGPQLKTARDLMKYLERKLGGVDPDNAKEVAALKQKDPNSFVTLTTAHKAKGLEWEKAFLMKPGEYDPEGDKIRNEEQGRQEMNAFYVAATRPRKTLMVSADDEP